MYVISEFEIDNICSENYFLSRSIGAKLSSQTLTHILKQLNTQEKREITEKQLMNIALQYEVNSEELKQILLSKLRILRPLLPRKIPFIYLNTDDELVEKLLYDTLGTEYNVHCCPKDFLDFQTPSLVIYYRQNYSDPDFKRIHHALIDDVYLVTCGVIHHQLLIDNLYFNHSGLPTHFSNLHLSMMNNNSLSFYRGLYQSQLETFPMLSLTPCQRGYIAYSIYQFLARFLKFDDQPTPHDSLNWRWHVDLLTFGLQKEEPVFEPQYPEINLKASVDPDVYNAILKTHSKEALTFIPFGNMCLSHANPKTIASIAALESNFVSPDHKKTVIHCASSPKVLDERKPSLRHFSTKRLDFSDMNTLLINSFSPNSLGHRPYPSAGALYPIEPILFIFNERVFHDMPFESGCYHFKAVNQTLELIKTMEMLPTINRLFHGLVDADAPPNLCILYVMHIGKSIFKYRYRGYRHALMEVGSMYQQVTLVGQSLGLGSTVWSGFNDYQVMHELGLDRRLFLPLTMQFLGYRELIK